MTKIPVELTYKTGLKRNIFHNARLTGSWDTNGYYSDRWTSVPMQQTTAEDGCPCFTATVQFDESQIGYLFRWGVILDTPIGNGIWGIPTEINDHTSSNRYRSFNLQALSTTGIQQREYKSVR